MTDSCSVRISKINIGLLLVAWASAIAMFNLSEDSEVEFTPIEIVSPYEKENHFEEEPASNEEEITPLVAEETAADADETVHSEEEPASNEEEITPLAAEETAADADGTVHSEVEPASNEEEITSLAAEETTADADETVHSEEEATSIDEPSNTPPGEPIIPPNVNIVPASQAKAERRKGRVKVNAIYQSHPAELFPWLMERGVRILLFDRNRDLLAEVTRDGVIEQSIRGGFNNGGVMREAKAEVNEFVTPHLPHNIGYAVVWWPDKLWQRILNPIKAHNAHSAQIAYQIQNDELVVTIHKVITRQGIIYPIVWCI